MLSCTSSPKMTSWTMEKRQSLRQKALHPGAKLAYDFLPDGSTTVHQDTGGDQRANFARSPFLSRPQWSVALSTREIEAYRGSSSPIAKRSQRATTSLYDGKKKSEESHQGANGWDCRLLY